MLPYQHRSASGVALRDAAALRMASHHLTAEDTYRQRRDRAHLDHPIQSVRLKELALLLKHLALFVRTTASVAMPIPLIIDTDMSIDVDDVGALCVALEHLPTSSFGWAAPSDDSRRCEARAERTRLTSVPRSYGDQA